MNEAITDSVVALLNYNWHDELRDYEQQPEGRDVHILRHMIRLRDAFIPEGERGAFPDPRAGETPSG